MSLFDLKILTPEKSAFVGQAEKVIVRTTEGDVGIFARHIDYVSALSIGKLEVIFEDSKKVAAVAGGFVSVNQGNVTILTDFLEWSDEIDVTRAETAREKAETSLKTKLSDSNQILMEVKLKKALNRLSVAKK